MNHFTTRRRLRGFAALGAALGTTLALAAPMTEAAASATRASSGLFGAADPTYDGAYRQSMALIGLKVASAPVPASAVSWLVGQQCANGSYEAYRADTSTPCAAANPAAFSGPDSNSTALAAIALWINGKTASATRAADALMKAQNADGGWGYTLGGASDADSTGLVLAALKGIPSGDLAAGNKPARAAVNRATGYLKGIEISCTATDGRFALPFQAGQTANPLASAQGLIGIAGGLPVTPGDGPAARKASCASHIEQQVASYLDQLLRTTQGKVPSAFTAGQTDWNATANAVLALEASGGARSAVRVGLSALGANTVAYTGSGATASPAALGTLIQAAVAGGQSPRRFGSSNANLVASLLGTLQK